MPLLELSSIAKEFPGVRALDQVFIDLEKGEVHAHCGENGAGKRKARGCLPRSPEGPLA